jgi:hypothetical protein
MEDCANKGDPVALATFQHNYLTSQPQVEPLFNYFTPHLNKLWEFYHPVAANVAVSALVDFASACYLEIMTEGMRSAPQRHTIPITSEERVGSRIFIPSGSGLLIGSRISESMSRPCQRSLALPVSSD